MTRRNFFFLLSLLSVVIGVLSHASTIPVEWQAKVNQRVAFFAEDDSGALIMDGYPKGLYLVSSFIVYCLNYLYFINFSSDLVITFNGKRLHLSRKRC